MAKHSQRARFIAALEGLGLERDDQRSRKYTCFKHENGTTFLVGKRGALRKTKSSIELSVTLEYSLYKPALLELGGLLLGGSWNPKTVDGVRLGFQHILKKLIER